MTSVFDSYTLSRLARFFDQDVGAWLRAPDKKPLLQQMREAGALWRRYRFFPYQYFKHDLYVRGADQVRDYIPSVFADKSIDAINPAECAPWLEDKVAFDRRARAAGLPVIETFALISIKGGRVQFRDIEDKPLTQADFLAAAQQTSPRAIFVKPRFGGQGVSAHRFELGEAGLMRHGAPMDERALTALLGANGFDDFLVQPYFEQHPALSALNAKSVNTLRVVTFLAGDKVEIVGALVRVGSGKGDTDNWSAGGRIANVALPSGQVSSRVRVKRGYGPADPTGIAGAIIPHTAAVADLVERGARVFAPIRHIGWDIAIGADGPCVIEANFQSQFLMLQDACGGLGDTAFGRELASLYRWS